MDNGLEEAINAQILRAVKMRRQPKELILQRSIAEEAGVMDLIESGKCQYYYKSRIMRFTIPVKVHDKPYQAFWLVCDPPTL